MSLSIDGVWKAGVWATTVWADGVWREGEFISPVANGINMIVGYEKKEMTLSAIEPTMIVGYEERKMTV